MTDLILIGPMRTTRPCFRFRSRLDDVMVGFRYVWNSRARAWSFDTIDAAGETIVAGTRMATGVDLWAPFADPRLPPGQLFVVDDSGRNREVPRDGWREDFRTIYRPIADVIAARGTAREVL